MCPEVTQRRLRVLVVDDDEGVCITLKKMLSSSYDVETALDAETGLRLLGSGPAFGAAIVDDRLPGMRGVELLSRLRDQWPLVVRLLTSGWQDFDMLVTAVNDGQVHGFIDKPFTQEKVHTLLSQAIMVAEVERERTTLLQRLAHQNKALEQVVGQRTNELAERNRQLEEMATRDPLTGLYNRRMAEEKLANEFARLQRYTTPFSVIILDLDHFKNVNDQYGHAAGDAVLRGVATLLVRRTRKVDAVARFGGEEFLVILPNTEIVCAVAAAERIRLELAADRTLLPCGETIAITGSLGVAEAAANEQDWQSAVNRADEALYAAKQGGRNRVCERRLPHQL